MKEDIAKRIKTARTEADLSVVDVHKRLKVTRQTVYNWEETGEIREEALEGFCKLTKTEPAYIRYGVSGLIHNKKSASVDWDIYEEAFIFSKQVLIQYDIDDPAFEFRLLRWKYDQLCNKEKQSEAEKMAAFSKFMQTLEIQKTEDEVKV